MVEASCKEYNRSNDRYKKQVWLANPFNSNQKLMTPRIIPARSKLEPVLKELAAALGVEHSEDGLLAFRSVDIVLQELLSRDTGKLKMPSLPEFYGGLRLPIVISRDATGKGSLQFTTLAARTPWASKSAQMLHIFGFGNCGDDRKGSSGLFGSNLERINAIVDAAAAGRTTPIEHGGKVRDILVDPYFTDDVSCLRHGEHLANSGWCGCSRDAALRRVPPKPKTPAEMRTLVNGDPGGRCRELSCEERDVLSHNPVPGEPLPRPCIADNCKFGHDRSTVAQEYTDLLAMEAVLSADKTKKAKAKYSLWRMLHAWKGANPHFNVPPGLYGKPMLRHHFNRQILDALHLALLGLPKTPWKHGVKNNSSDDARELISAQLKLWKHPLDMRTKDEGRVREAKWFTGEAWVSFCAGTCGSPGGPVAIATIVMIIADDLQQRGVNSGSTNAPTIPATAAAAAGRGGRGSGRASRAAVSTGRGRGRANYADRMASKAPAPQAQAEALTSTAERAQLEYEPSAVEADANQESLAIIRELYGSRAQTLIDILLSFDAYFKWYYPFKQSIPFGSSDELKEARAFSNCCTAIDMQESFERITASSNGHGSFLPHGAVFKVTRDILNVGDVWAHDLSALELQNADSKRTFEAGGARNLTFRTEGTTHKKAAGGEARLIVTKGYGATAATSTLKKMLIAKTLRVGDGMYATPRSRQAERLFGEKATGRTKLVKIEWGGTEIVYNPAEDNCLDAFVRIIAARASADAKVAGGGRA